jgi:hypothetical protein
MPERGEALEDSRSAWRRFASTTEDTDAGDEARVQLVLAVYEPLNGARRVSTPAQPPGDK